ncbi:hypothetical protein D8674_040156 [Pyrus ussuriensis x Pyrus communis]|uniref:DUF7722 domain-containing protein n=1 Tax=Pyrus ussuriensis x Pyrus communis TaxID=2448454 RepID=A0A5N5G2I1_9ROSA|nr:hypothetical protein D8674_031624 [Pyrus ussuriensis x Pyrus communis]KAB2607582.1 hypothetical protein D8674_040156 [Pyrus ussuriensis x Pyrus communis]
MESRKMSSGVGFFKMPLHYPRYTKKDYEGMAEWKLDRLLAEYGLPMHGDLAHKREFAMGAFLWPDTTVQDASSSLGDKKLK